MGDQARRMHKVPRNLNNSLKRQFVEVKLDEALELLTSEQSIIGELVRKSEQITNRNANANQRSLLLAYLHLQASLNHLRSLRQINPTYLKHQTEQESTGQSQTTSIQQIQNLLRSQSHVYALETKTCRLAKKYRDFSKQLGYHLPFVAEHNVQQALEAASFD